MNFVPGEIKIFIFNWRWWQWCLGPQCTTFRGMKIDSWCLGPVEHWEWRELTPEKRPKWHVDSPSTAEEWEDAARSVGVQGPGSMQQAKHMADAAVQALGLDYDLTAPSDITEHIEALRLRGGA